MNTHLIKITAIAFLLTGQPAFATTADADKTLEIVVEVSAAKKEDIYASTKLWMAETFISSKSVIEVDDKEAGRIIGNISADVVCTKGFWACAGLKGNYLNATMRIDIKDAKFRITLSKMTWSSPPTTTANGYDRVEFYSNEKVDEMMPTLEALAESLKQSIATGKAKNDW